MQWVQRGWKPGREAPLLHSASCRRAEQPTVATRGHPDYPAVGSWVLCETCRFLMASSQRACFYGRGDAPAGGFHLAAGSMHLAGGKGVQTGQEAARNGGRETTRKTSLNEYLKK